MVSTRWRSAWACHPGKESNEWRNALFSVHLYLLTPHTIRPSWRPKGQWSNSLGAPLLNLCVDFVDDTGTDSLSTLTDGEAGSDLEGNVVEELSGHLEVVSGHNELLVGVLGTLGEVEGDGDVGGTDEELGTVVGHEGGETTSLSAAENLHVSNLYSIALLT